MAIIRENSSQHSPFIEVVWFVSRFHVWFIWFSAFSWAQKIQFSFGNQINKDIIITNRFSDTLMETENK